MSALLTDLGTVVTSVFGWVGTVATTLPVSAAYCSAKSAASPERTGSETASSGT